MTSIQDFRAWKKAFAREHTYEVSSVGLFIGGAATYCGLLTTAYPDWPITPKFIDEALGDWSIWVFIAGLLVFMASAYFLWKIIERMNKFKRLFNTESRKVFKENMESLDALSYYHLPERYRKRFLRQKEKFGFK